MENLDALPAPQQPGSGPNPVDSSMLGLDGSQPSIRSVSLVLQALVPLVISFVLLLAGRRLYSESRPHDLYRPFNSSYRYGFFFF